MMHRSFASSIANDTNVETTQLDPPLISPFSHTLSMVEPTMIKQAAPQHPNGLTKLQHRLLYESDSDSSFDLTFSSPSSTGSNSEYSDVGYQSSNRSRTSSHGQARRMGGHASSSHHESISSVLGSSIAIQRVLMGTNSTTTSKKSQRQSVRAIASAFEKAGRSGATAAPKAFGRQLSRVSEANAQSTVREDARSTRPQQSLDGDDRRISTENATPISSSVSFQTIGSDVGGADAHGHAPARLKITKQPFKGPLSAPAAISTQSLPSLSSQSSIGEPSLTEQQFVFPPRSSVQKRWPGEESPPRVRSFISLNGQLDHDEPAFDIVASPSRKRTLPLPRASMSSTAAVQRLQGTSQESTSSSSGLDSPPLPSSRSAVSRDSVDSRYSYDSLSGHPFSLQLPVEDDRDLRSNSAASMLEFDEAEYFRSPLISRSPLDADERQGQQSAMSSATPALSVEEVVSSARTATSTLQPLVLSTSRPSSSSSSSTTTLTPSMSASASTSMRVNDDATFPLPPFTSTSAIRSAPVAPSSRAKVPETDRLAQINTIGASTKFEALAKSNMLPKPNVSTRTPTLELGADQSALSQAQTELKREAQALLASIRTLADQLDSSIPATHRLATSPSTTPNPPPFVAVDTAYSHTWRLIDAWYWSSFHLTPPS